MYDGLWVVEFQANNDFGWGVVVFNGNQIMGGDWGYYYFGQINTTGKLTGEINAVRFNQNVSSVFGEIDNFTLLLKDGVINNTKFNVTAVVKGKEELSITIRGTKKVDANESA